MKMEKVNDTVADAKKRFTQTLNDSKIDNKRLLKILIKIGLTQVPYARLLTAFVKTVTSKEVQDHPPKVMTELLTNYMNSFFDDASDITAFLKKITEKVEEEGKKIKEKVKRN
jgi:hypothetical protein